MQQSTELKKYYGKYRGTVLNNVDPKKQGRIQAVVSDVSALLPTSWAMPCVPVAGIQFGVFTVPMIGAGVWIEFEQGDPDFPIWVGSYWGSPAEVPVTALLTLPAVPAVVVQTPLQNTLVVSDTPIPPMLGPCAMLRSGPSSITIDPTGVTITALKVMINGVTIINNGALTVTL
jgi:hypothetical protein